MQRTILVAVVLVCVTAMAIAVLLRPHHDRPGTSDFFHCPAGRTCG